MKSFAFILLFLYSIQLFAQETTIPKTVKVNVDCSNGGDCYPSYIREQIPLVDFVRDRLDADVHVIVTALYNSSGSVKYSLHFMGRNQFSKYDDTLQYSVPPGSNDDTQRTLFVNKLKMGLIPFLCKTAQCDKLNISFDDAEKKGNNLSEKDPWNAWVFQISANGYVNGSQNYFSGSGYFNLGATRETEKRKTSISMTNNEEIQKYKDGKDEYKYTFLNHYFNFDHSERITQHVALGLSANATNSLFSNYRYKLNGTANVEYSIFPYKDFNTKRFILLYTIGPNYNRYYDSTIYLKSKELVFQQSLGSIYSYIQPWGSTHVGVFWNNYLHDFKLNNLSINGAIQFKITKGLNFALWGYYSFVHDQINIRKGDIDLNQLLVKNRELLSSFDYNLGVGISYRFGSKYNNAVNPAFRGLSYNINL